MNLHKLQAVREGHRATIAEHLQEIEDAFRENNIEDVQLLIKTIENIMLSLASTDADILNKIDTENTAEEVKETAMYNIRVKRQLQKYNKFHVLSDSTIEVDRDNINHSSRTEPSSSNHGEQMDYIRDRTSIPLSNSFHHKLPTISMPTFSGDLLTYQTFWDSFESSVHNNPSLTDVQKFSYLKSLLEGDAARTIDGFALTNANYSQALCLLKERYGQKQKITSAYMQTLLKLPTPADDIRELRQFYDMLETNIRGLESLGELQDTYGNLLIPIILERLPPETRRHLAREHGTGSWTLPDLRKSLNREIEIMEAGESQNTKQERFIPTASFYTAARNRDNRKSLYRTEHSKKKCVYCDEIHMGDCKKVSDVKSRIQIIKLKHLCFNCLSKGHQVSGCPSKSRCRQCHGKHHTSTCSHSQSTFPQNYTNKPVIGNHETQQSEVTGSYRNWSTNIEAGDTTILFSKTHHSDVLLKTATAPVCANGRYAEANVLMDEGAQRSFINQKLADKLQLNIDGTDIIHLSAFGDPAHSVQHLNTATINLVADDGMLIPIRVLIVPVIAKPINNVYRNSIKHLKYLQGLKLAHPVTMDTTFDISLLIGADFYWQIVGDKIIRGDGPTAVSSRIGYFLSGPLHVESSYPPSNVMEVIATHVSETTNLTRFWDIESMGVSKGDCEDTDASSYLQQYQKSCISFSDGNYTAKLPWKQNHKPLPSNYNITKKRTECTIKRLSQKPQMLMKYNDIIQEQENRGLIERVDESSRAKRVHYIPHHGVEKNSTTTPIRIVYDCSCRQSERSPSLNDCLESTPPELNDLTTLLLRFRLGRYAVSTDIEKAFLHVGLHEDDRDATRFLWLSDPTDPKSQLVTYRFRVVLFGATCSPFILNATLLKHMTLNASNPAANIITRDLYVDNVISSFQQEQDLLTYFRYARALMSEAGFNLRSWTSNSSKLCELALAEKVLDKDKVVKVLGMLWDPDNDEMSFVQRTIVNSERTTKRSILKQTSKLYDPLGLLSPVTVRAKLLVQDLWKKKFDWDTPLPVDIINTWADLSIDLNSVIQTKFQRPYFPTTENTANSANFNLHVFVDASARAYGAVAYLTSGHTSTLVFANNRVAPVKEITLPRLELMAALIGARVTHHVSNVFTCKKITCWSDSQIVLSWLKSTKTLKRFILNRVEEIKKLTPDIEWRYCPTDQNPADLQTRGLTATQLQSSTLWKNGPTWLSHNNKWPTLEQTRAITFTTFTEQHSEEEIVSDKRGNSGLRQILELNRYSSFHKLLRVTAYVIRFTKNCRVTYNYRQICPLSTEELRLAEGKLIETCQQQYFPDVIQDLKSQKKRSLIIRQLRLYLDKDGCIRCGGRIHNAQLPETTRFPFLMSPKSHVTRLIIEDAHYNQLHAGVAHTVTHLRQKYWIPSIRQHVKSVLRRCVICRKVTGRPYTAPDPPPLPVSRVIIEPPFSVTGVDFTGALYIKEKKVQQKVYICLFTCAKTRAVHLEIVPDLTEESFMLAFRRFISRRSLPRLMISDNGTTFHAAANQIRRLYNSQNLHTALTQRGTHWQFIPKRAPWYGGMWERLIGVMKTAIKKVLGKASINLQTLQTIVTEVEAMMNDRPITYVSSARDDPEPLTPSHLLHGRRLTTLPFYDTVVTNDTPGYHSKGDDVRQRAKRREELINHYWHRWKHEYLTSLREYQRSSGTTNQTIQVGDVVIVQDDFTPRLQWSLAVVDELLTGNDGFSRAARIRTSGGLTTRPIIKLYPLEIIQKPDE